MSLPIDLNRKQKQEDKNFQLSIDEYVGQRLRDFRERVGLTLMECAKHVGISHQQIHKYEMGQTKISPGMLYKHCSASSP